VRLRTLISLNLEMERYSRQVPLIGVDGQRKLATSSALIVGIGGLGSAVAFYLTAMGIGKLILVDEGRIELSNLNRQILYSSQDLGLKKVEVAKSRLKALNPHVDIEIYDQRLDEVLAKELVKRVDIVVDALDNWESRLILNKVCVKYGRPLIHAGVEGFYGQIMTVVPGKGPCLACLFREVPRASQRAIPVLGAVPGVLGALEAIETVKVLLSVGKPLVGRMLIIDLLSMDFKIVEIRRNPRCPVCSKVTSNSIFP